MSIKYLHIRAILVLLLVLSFGEVCGQQYPLESYQKSVDMQSLLFRGRVERRYAYRYQGTYFAYQDKYVKGEVYFNKRRYSDILINLNSHRDRVSVTKSEGHLPVILDRRYVEWFKIGSRLFVNIEKDKYQGLNGGYYEVLFDDGKNRLLKRIYKEYKEILERDVVEREFLSKIDYYLVIGGKAEKVHGMKSFAKLFPQSKKDIKRVNREVSFTVKEDKDLLFKAYMEAVR